MAVKNLDLLTEKWIWFIIGALCGKSKVEPEALMLAKEYLRSALEEHQPPPVPPAEIEEMIEDLIENVRLESKKGREALWPAEPRTEYLKQSLLSAYRTEPWVDDKPTIKGKYLYMEEVSIIEEDYMGKPTLKVDFESGTVNLDCWGSGKWQKVVEGKS